MTDTAVALDRDFTALPLPRRTGWIVLLGSLTAIGAFTIDLYLPSFPVLERDLSASASSVQLTLTGTTLGMAVGQLVVGQLSDAVGRRRPLLAGLALHVVASLLCAVAPSVAVLGVLRVLQGLGTAAAAVIALAVVRDRFDGRGGALLVARLMLILGASPVFAPGVGSALLSWTGWRGIFLVLGAMGLALGVVVAFALPETLPPERRTASGVRAGASAYVALLRDRGMLGLVIVAGLQMAAIFGYVSGSSFVFQQQYGLSHLGFGLVFAAGGVAEIVGTQLNGSLVHRFSSQAMLTVALVAGTACAGVLLLCATTGLLGLAGVVGAMSATMFCLGLATPNAPVLALERHGEAAGSAAALIGAAQFTVAAVASPLVSLLGLPPAAGMGAVVLGSIVLALVVFVVVARPALTRAPALVQRPSPA